MAHNRSRLTMLAGWLFADLFLVLLIAGLALVPGRSPAPHARPSATPTPKPTHRLGLDPHYLDFSINLSPDAFRSGARDQLLNDVNSTLNRLDPSHRLVGFVLVFASDDQNDVARAISTATQALRLLHRRSLDFASSTGLGYWNGNNNDFEFKVFLLN
jgi:hypothetical protein